MSAEEKYAYRVCMNREPAGWRMRPAQRLRLWAARLDGRISPALEFHSRPRLPTSVIHNVLRRGVDHMARDLKAEARQAAEEKLFRRHHPDLFEDA